MMATGRMHSENDYVHISATQMTPMRRAFDIYVALPGWQVSQLSASSRPVKKLEISDGICSQSNILRGMGKVSLTVTRGVAVPSRARSKRAAKSCAAAMTPTLPLRDL